MKPTRFRTSILTLCAAAAGLLFAPLISSGQEDLETLYFQASEKAQQGDFAGALEIYNKIVANEGEFAWDDYGPVFGGIYYDKGICHLQLKQFDEAKEAFRICHEEFPNKPNDKKTEPPKVASTNMRWELAVFQWGYCEQQDENYQGALDQYEKFVALNPDPTILKPIHSAYILRKGVCLIGVGKLDEGEKEIRRLFDEFTTTFRGTSGQLLFQAMLDLANGWIQNAETDGDKVRDELDPATCATPHGSAQCGPRPAEVTGTDTDLSSFSG
ncbi:MAG: tetratricopeptide repeat protein, partial [Verrucomicrobiota bacterium]